MNYSMMEMTDQLNAEFDNVLRQSLQLICKLPLISIYAYYAYQHMELGMSLYIRTPKKEYSIAENLLYMLREDGKFTELEAKVRASRGARRRKQLHVYRPRCYLVGHGYLLRDICLYFLP